MASSEHAGSWENTRVVLGSHKAYTHTTHVTHSKLCEQLDTVHEASEHAEGKWKGNVLSKIIQAMCRT